ncbi:hypothetical protein LSTR_LSTR007503 [Laodelphax striatellus]|uniref:Uncharacterized protein n=1 Tax=Laodelphax striatellus TaxID=195883 RepID=A0A482X5E3_LAOST|nr:hypothetical protein LSTR_LSTR007503 [Laodelphax striatellus]
MCDKRIKLSVSSYRKLSSEKEEKETNLLKTFKKVDSFFKPSESEEGCSSHQQHNVSDTDRDTNIDNKSAAESEGFELKSDSELTVGADVQVSENSDIYFLQKQDKYLP